MPVTPTYPGVYVEEAPATNHVINGVTTADTAFIDVFERGPTNVPCRITTFGEFTSRFGGLHHKSRASYGIYQFFQNGGSVAWVVRITSSADTFAVCKLADFTLEAIGPGEWANRLQAITQPSASAGLIDLVIREISPPTANNPNPVVTESEGYRNLSTDPAHPRYIARVLSAESQLAAVQPGSITPPAAGGTGTATSATGSILDANNIMNAKRGDYLDFSGGTAELTVDGAAALGTQGDPANGEPSTGMYTLDAIAPAKFNLMCIPAMAGFTSDEWVLAFDSAFNYCQDRSAFLIADPPTAVLSSEDPAAQVQDISTWFTTTASISGKTSHAAIYFPQIVIPDPNSALAESMSTETSGTLAGLYARTDAARGVWNAPAGTGASLVGVVHPVVTLNDQLNGELNPLGINGIRTFPVVGTVSWGARTIDGADVLQSEWKYVPVRRLALYLEQSLQQGTRWTVFEPNDEPLWASLRLSVGAFMDGLYKQGAFAGRSAKESYFVVCDATTTTPTDQQQGRVNIQVGFAPIYPAEFVIITISQITDQPE